MLEAGKSFVFTVQADERPEGIGLRIQTVQSLEEKSVQMQKAIRIFVRDSGPLKHVAAHLNRAREGLVSYHRHQGGWPPRDRGGNWPSATASRRRWPPP